jgi:hypothetical protein
MFAGICFPIPTMVRGGRGKSCFGGALTQGMVLSQLCNARPPPVCTNRTRPSHCLSRPPPKRKNAIGADCHCLSPTIRDFSFGVPWASKGPDKDFWPTDNGPPRARFLGDKNVLKTGGASGLGLSGTVPRGSIGVVKLQISCGGV